MPPKSAKQQLKAAKSLLDAGEPAAAAEICDALLAADASNYHAHVLLGVSHAARGDTPAAVASYAAAARLRPATALAHKGVVDVVRPADPDPSHRLALARAHLALAAPARAAPLLHALAKRDPTLAPEALRALRAARAADPPAAPWADRAAWREADLLAAALPESRLERAEALEGPLAGPLDALEDALAGSALPLAEDAVFALVVERVLARVARGALGSAEAVARLCAWGAHEAVLALAEMDAAPPVEERIVKQAAARALHAAPFRRGARARAVVAAELLRTLPEPDVAEALAGLRALRAGRVGRARVAASRAASTTEAVVQALMHLRRAENKLALELARGGQEVAGELGERERAHALLGLLAASALRGDRRYKDAIQEYGKVRVYAQRVGDAWMEAAANRGLVETSVIGHGRKSMQTSTAVEEAAGSEQNLYGVLESTWTDALAGDLDTERMAELTEAAVRKAKEERGDRPSLRWEYTILDSTFSVSDAELAAVSSTRLGQIVLHEHGPTQSSLERAQRCQMEAANLFRGSPSPFAQLGWVFEQMGHVSDAKKMSMRAIRCYEKALGLDAAQPLASRRLARVLMDKGLRDDAAEVARQTSDRNPRARWAYNLMGWSKIEERSYSEADLCFRNALRGKVKPSAKAEEALFGTNVGRTADDNDLVVDVDSWRGLSVAYRGEGKIGPAVACINDALSLLAKPPVFYMTAALYDIEALQGNLCLLLEAEKAVLLQVNRESQSAVLSFQSLLRDSRSPFTSKVYLSEAHMYMAAREWIAGCYSRATSTRLQAADILEEAVSEQMTLHAHLNPASSFKQLGDTLMEAATSHPEALKRVVRSEIVDVALSRAVTTYSRAMHYAPWEASRAQDLAVALLRTAVSTDNELTAKDAVSLLLRKQANPSVLAMAFLTFAKIAEKVDIAEAANELAVFVSKNMRSKEHVVALNSSIAIHSSSLVGSGGVSNAVSAIRHDPTDWRGWYAVAVVREADARRNSWPAEMIQSSEEAYKEADRLGGGPAAVKGIVRCGSELLRLHRSSMRSEDVNADACFYASTASRAGEDIPSTCNEIIDEARNEVEGHAISEARKACTSNNAVDLYKYIHLYPFVSEVVGMKVTAC